jgi:hypothetical protein
LTTILFSILKSLLSNLDNMQTKAVLLSLILAAVGTRAAPAIEARQRTSIPLGIYTGSGCNDQGANTQPWSVVNVPTDGQCHSVSVVISGFVDSGRVDITPENPDPLPAGCSRKLPFPSLQTRWDVYVLATE